MLTLYHAPQTRSSRIVWLLEELEEPYELKVVGIPRMDGSGGRDPANPHPEGKVPALLHDGQVITERGAIILHLTSLFPDSGMAPKIGTPDWGVFAPFSGNNPSWSAHITGTPLSMFSVTAFMKRS